MSAPIGRLKIRQSARKRVASAIGPVQASEPHCELEVADETVARQDDALPRYYPFAPSLIGDCDE